MTWLCGIRVSMLALIACGLFWVGIIIGNFQGRRAMRRRLRSTLKAAGSRFGEQL